jgi:hypothetical protein
MGARFTPTKFEVPTVHDRGKANVREASAPSAVNEDVLLGNLREDCTMNGGRGIDQPASSSRVSPHANGGIPALEPCLSTRAKEGQWINITPQERWQLTRRIRSTL